METLKFALQGMTKLDRSKFVKTLRMPYLKVPAQSVGKIVGLPSILNNTIKKEEGLKPIMDSADNKNEKLVLFNYDKLRQNGEETTRSKIVTELKAVIGDEAPSEFGTLEKEVMYEKWSVASCLKAVLPPGLEFKGFSQIGHIAHLNLKEEILPYRFVIGELIHDKLPNVKTVVNKTDKINNEFRVFDMELLAGEPKYETETAENGLRYKMDFSKVFWNPRLSNIHERIVKKFDKDSVVFDITSGIGPFVLPAVKQRNIRKAFANDLNPLSIDYLKENIKLNKISVDKIETFVMDAADFIRDVIPEQYSKIAESDEKELACNNEISGINFHAIMNLPALSLTFLPIFRGLLRHHSKLRAYFQSHPFWIHCHFFVKASADEEDEWYRNNAECFVRDTVKIPDMILQDVHYLRIVAPRKQMYCVSFQLPEEYAFSTESVNTTEINNKRKLDGDSESNELSKVAKVS
ncbi:met-10+ like-protein domain-containing protein [Ditylenchus destructor]|uniref:tRNA (guanine(37)-N1)-methyltransferase n=1 Tax=Ditylenchus destructor TaxID=166010 RepID=A0AAD4R8B6_9BILA|nr:met-10+ like-protein domain-containing protein [Ditylenchus destructor]